MNFTFLAEKYSLNSDNQVWSRPDYQDIAYNDGDDIEERIASIISHASDLTVLSDELRAHCTDWPSLYHLSGSRANVLRPFEQQLKGDILEIGAGCGAITRYLGECGAQVLALEGTSRRASIARSRTRDLDNVSVLSESFADFECAHQFDVITLIGVLEYASLFMPGDSPAEAMLARVHSMLKPGGLLILAIENRLGLKYFSGYPEDHVGVSMYGIENKYLPGEPYTYGRRELASVLQKSHFSECVFYAPFPDYKFPRSVISEVGYKDPTFNAVGLIAQTVGTDAQSPDKLHLSMELAWEKIIENRLGLELSNSFIVLARSEQRDDIQKEFLACAFSSRNRKKKYFKEIVFRKPGKLISVEARYPYFSDEYQSERFRFSPSSNSDYYEGAALSEELIGIVSREQWSVQQLAIFFNRYAEIIRRFLPSGDVSSKTQSSCRLDCPPHFLDALPHNIIVMQDEPRLIDLEWSYYANIPFAWLILRCLILLPGQVTKFGAFSENSIETWGDLFFELASVLSIPVDEGSFNEYLHDEAIFQSIASGVPADVVLDGLRCWANAPLPKHQISGMYIYKEEQLTKLNSALSSMTKVLDEIYASSSWRLTAPLRIAVQRSRQIQSVLRLALQVIRNRGIGFVITKSFALFRGGGIQSIRMRLIENIKKAGKDISYDDWYQSYFSITSSVRKRIPRLISMLQYKPLISILIPVYNPNLIHLKEAVESVRNQLYSNWELCIADDASTDIEVQNYLQSLQILDDRIKVVFRSKNGHISESSNSALDLVDGEYVALLDQDDLITEDALFWVLNELQGNDRPAILYSDEDKINLDGVLFEPYFKSDFNYELFLSQNIVSHFGVYRTDIIKKIGGFRVGYEGSQDWDLALRVLDVTDSSAIKHIKRVLYHWRVTETSTAGGIQAKPYAIQASIKAVTDHLARNNIQARVDVVDECPTFLRVQYELPEILPLVSIIIPTKDRVDLLRKCVASIVENSTYPNFEILILDNGSVEAETLEYLDEQSGKSNFKVLRDAREFNFSRLNNEGAKEVNGEYLCFLNNDVEVISPNWIQELLSFAQKPDVGAVGARLWYPDRTLQHGGIILGIGGVGSHAHHKLPKGSAGYFGKAVLNQEVSAVTAACMLIKKSDFDHVGGFDEHLAVAFNDVDLCLKLRRAGLKNIWAPYAELYHHESASRGKDGDPKNNPRLAAELEYMFSRWKDLLANDPYYNPSLTLHKEDFSLASPPRLPVL